MFQKCNSTQIFNFISSYSKVDLDVPLREQVIVLRETLIGEGYIVTDELYVTKLFNRDIIKLISTHLDFSQIINLKQVSRFFSSVFNDTFWVQYLKQKYDTKYETEEYGVKNYVKYLEADISEMRKSINSDEVYRKMYISQKCKLTYMFGKELHKYKFFIATEEVDHEGYQLIGTCNSLHETILDKLSYEDVEYLSEIPLEHFSPVFDNLFQDDLEKSYINWKYDHLMLRPFQSHIVENVKGISYKNDAIYHPSILNLDKYSVDRIEQQYGDFYESGYVDLFIYKHCGEDSID